MINLSYDFSALAVLFVITAALMRSRKTGLLSSRFFVVCIAVNLLAALSGIASGYIINNPSLLPHTSAVLICTISYLAVYAMTTLYTLYTLRIIDRYSDTGGSGRSFAVIAYILICLCCCTALVINLFTGVIFSFDDRMMYHRGSFWILGFLLLAASMLIIIYTALSRRSSMINPSVRFVKQVIPTVYLLVIIKLLCPGANIEAFIGSIAALFIFIYFKCTSVDIDPTTRLRNLNSFTSELKYRQTKGEAFQVILISLRDFGSINSMLGYADANALLCRISQWLKDYWQGNDLFRYAPVSFAVILPIRDKGNCADNVHRIMDSFPSAWMCNDRSYHVSAYYVDYVCDHGFEDPYRIIEAIDFARKEMRTGSADHIHFNDELADRLADRKKLITYLKDSIEAKRFEVYLQPIYSHDDGCFTSAEALLRLRGENGCFISPEIFAPIAEESSLDPAINHQLLETVCSFLGSCRDLPIKSISVNLTMQQLRDLGFADELMRTVRKYSVPEHRLALEVTERIMLSEDSAVQLSLFKLRLAGFTLLLDDFGTGYSNFSSLLRCRFDRIKLDKSLLSADRGRDIDIIATLIELFHRNGQSVVVEGVETADQCEQLFRAHADYIQGYFYSRPLPMDEYTDFVLSHNKAVQ